MDTSAKIGDRVPNDSQSKTRSSRYASATGEPYFINRQTSDAWAIVLNGYEESVFANLCRYQEPPLKLSLLLLSKRINSVSD